MRLDFQQGLGKILMLLITISKHKPESNLDLILLLIMLNLQKTLKPKKEENLLVLLLLLLVCFFFLLVSLRHKFCVICVMLSLT